jgi:hypothetical protein
MRILEEILESIKVKNNLHGENIISNYLNNLKVNVITLRRAYSKVPVIIDYKETKNQEAYLLAYFPHYTVPIFEVLEYINKNHPSYNIPINLCLIGAGPAPEVIGFLKFINNHLETNKHINNINIELFDIASEWLYARNILKNIIKKYIPSRLKINKFKIDVSKNIINSSVLLKRYRDNKYKRVVVIQNIINEIEQTAHKYFIENVVKCYKNLVAGSFLILIDLDYRSNFNVTYQLEKRLNTDVIKRFGGKGDIEISRTNIFLPEIIENNLFEYFEDSELWPKKRVKYGYSIFFKQK